MGNPAHQERMLAQLRADLRTLRDRRGYLRAGLPRFPGLFGRDSLIAGWQTLRDDPSFARAALVRLAQLQGKRLALQREEEPGKILHEFYEPEQLIVRYVRKWRVTRDFGLPYFGSVDATPLWLIVLHAYVTATDDRALLDTLWPNAVAAYGWVCTRGDHDGDGFLDYESHNEKALRHHGWKDSDEFGDLPAPIAPVEVQGYAYAALNAFADLADSRGEATIAAESRARAAELRRAFLATYRVDDFFAFARNGNGALVPWITSNPGHLLFTGILDAPDAAMVAARLFRDDLWTPYGIRTLSTEDPLFSWQSYHRGSVWPHDNWFFWKGLRAIGDLRAAERVKEALIAAWNDLGRMTELYAVEPMHHTLSLEIRTAEGIATPCSPQAWASGALLDMLLTEDP